MNGFDSNIDALGESPTGADSESNIDLGGQAIEAMGNDLAAAASGHLRDVDMDDARDRLRDVQTALLGLGYSLADDHTSEEHVEQGDSRALSEVLRQFQDDFDLEITGRIDRDTYETILRNASQAMEVQARGPVDETGLYDDADAAMDHVADSGALLQSSDALDDDEQALLNLQDDLDAGIGPQEQEIL